jgi:hypothetical protein
MGTFSLRVAVVALVSGTAADTGTTPDRLQVDVDPVSAEFNVSLNGIVWLRGLAPTAGWVGAGTLRHTGSTTTTTGVDSVLGQYTETRFAWTAGGDGTEVGTAFRVFADKETVVLVQDYPNGVANSSSQFGNVVAFPSFAEGGCVYRTTHVPISPRSRPACHIAGYPPVFAWPHFACLYEG